MNNSSGIIANNYDSHAHQAYFLASLKTRFPLLIFTEQQVPSENKDTTVVTTPSPSSDLSAIKFTLFKDNIEIQVTGIQFIKRFTPSLIPVIAAPDSDPRIPARLHALDFIKQIIEDKIIFRCYRHKGKIVRTKLVSVISDTVIESKSYTIRGSLIKSSAKFEVSDYRWSGVKTEKSSS